MKRGGNYGWSVMEGPQPVHVEARRGPTPILPPIKVHPHSEAASITGGYVYHGTRLPELAGAYIYGDYQTGIIWGLRSQGDDGHLAAGAGPDAAASRRRSARRTTASFTCSTTTGRTRSIAWSRTRPPRSTHDFPRRLSQTGLFASTRDHQPAPGVIPYSVNAELWSDGATAERFLAVPGDGRDRSR